MLLIRIVVLYVFVCSYLDVGSVVIILPVEVEVFDADARSVSAGQQNCGAIHCFN